jgi:hypothetical protein
VLKDIWIDSDRIREGAILDELYNDAGEEDKGLVRLYFLTIVCHGDVLLTEPDVVDDTKDGLMHGLNLHNTKLFLLQRNGSAIATHKYTPGSERQVSRAHFPHRVPKYAHKTHYRIVFSKRGVSTLTLSRRSLMF